MKTERISKKLIVALLGLTVSLAFIELCLQTTHYLHEVLGREELDAEDMKPDVYRILCLGDSTTAIGGDSSWPGQLQEVLDTTSSTTRYVVINGGRTCSDSSDIVADLNDNLESFRPHLVIIMTGINDNGLLMYKHVPGSDSVLFEKVRVFKFFALMLARVLEEEPNEAQVLGKTYKEPTTRMNFESIAERLSREGITLVAMQYPLRPVQPLQEMLESISDITVVDNQDIFEEALEQGQYEDYFVDRFGGDFGHCTPVGNHLLANHLTQRLQSEGILR